MSSTTTELLKPQMKKLSIALPLPSSPPQLPGPLGFTCRIPPTSWHSHLHFCPQSRSREGGCRNRSQFFLCILVPNPWVVSSYSDSGPGLVTCFGYGVMALTVFATLWPPSCEQAWMLGETWLSALHHLPSPVTPDDQRYTTEPSQDQPKKHPAEPSPCCWPTELSAKLMTVFQATVLEGSLLSSKG